MRPALWCGQGSEFTYDDLAADLLRLHQRQLADYQVEAHDLAAYSNQCKEAFACDIRERVKRHELLSFLSDLRKQPVSTLSLGHGASSAGRLLITGLFCTVHYHGACNIPAPLQDGGL